ncbi:MFS transporter [Cetobacterium sp. SF1]|uniref:MFS transporter n=1 Tax=Cetobacterium sp. SF1 TaxID=3417654 RepID=UPI003CF31D3A
MNKNQIKKFFILYFLLSVTNNLVHPITPTYITLLKLPDYMFGVLYAAMALTNFLFSPFWGRMSDRKGRVYVAFISMLGYAVGQAGFGIARTPEIIIFFRLISGIFAGGFTVSALAYIADVSQGTDRTKYLSYYAAFTTMAASIGFLVGGLVGDLNIFLVFALQVVSLVGLGFGFKYLLPESLNEEHKKTGKLSLFERFKIFSWHESKDLLTPAVVVFLLTVMIASFSTAGYDNAFNFYIKADLGFKPSSNGIIKSITGLVGLIANFTLNIWIIKHFNGRKAIITIFLLAALSIGIVVMVGTPAWFIIANIGFYLFNAMYIPIQQGLMTKGQKSKYGVLSGLFSSAKALGMILGALFAGIIYEYGSKLPFYFCGLGFLIAGIVSYINYLQYKKIED